MAAEICRVHDAEIYCSFDFMRYVYMPAQISVRCSFGPLGIMAPKQNDSGGPLGIMAPKSDSGRSRRSRKKGDAKSESGRSARSRKNRDARPAKLTGQAVEKKDEEKPTVAAEEPSLASVRLYISMY